MSMFEPRVRGEQPGFPRLHVLLRHLELVSTMLWLVQRRLLLLPSISFLSSLWPIPLCLLLSVFLSTQLYAVLCSEPILDLARKDNSFEKKTQVLDDG